MKSKRNSSSQVPANKSLIKAERPRRRGRRKDGVLDFRARTSARNARPKKILLVGHGATSKALREGVLDLRSRAGKTYRATCQALGAHVGGELSAPQKALIDQAARLRLLTQFAWAEIDRLGPFKKTGELVAAFDAYRRAAADERSVLSLLGIERRVKELPTLQDYLKQSKGDGDGKAGKE